MWSLHRSSSRRCWRRLAVLLQHGFSTSSTHFPMNWTPVSQDTATRRDRFLTVPQLQLHPKALSRELCIHAYWERLMPAGSHDGWPDDSNVQVSFLLLNQVLWQGFGVGVSVGPLPKQLGCDVLNDGFIQPPTGKEENIIIHRAGGEKDSDKTDQWDRNPHLKQRISQSKLFKVWI